MEVERYARHLSLPGWGDAGQEKVKKASVLVVGLGGLGCVASTYLAMAGVGRIGLVDADKVSLSNLQRQTLYRTKDIGFPKAVLAEKRLRQINPTVDFKAHQQRLTSENAVGLIKNHDLVLDGTDNLSTRLIINQVCCQLDKPYVFGAVSGFDGQASVFQASQGPCLRCLFPNPPGLGIEPTEEQRAVFNTMPSIIGAVQATQAIKLILGRGDRLWGRLLLINVLDLSFQMVEIPKRKHCQVCG